MTEHTIAKVVDRLLGDADCHLHERVTQTIASRILGALPPRAVVVSLDRLGSSAWGTVRQFATMGPIEVYA